MSLFKTKKNLSAKTEKKEIPEKIKKVSIKKETEKISADKVVETNNVDSHGNLSSVLKKIRITEKATDLSQNHNVYVFEVDMNTNKKEIEKAIKTFYNVSPQKIRIIKISSKKVFSRGKKGVKSGGKKAYVYLKEGNKIEIL